MKHVNRKRGLNDIKVRLTTVLSWPKEKPICLLMSLLWGESSWCASLNWPLNPREGHDFTWCKHFPHGTCASWMVFWSRLHQTYREYTPLNLLLLLVSLESKHEVQSIHALRYRGYRFNTMSWPEAQSLHSKTSVYIPDNGITALSKVMVIKGRSKQVGSSEPSAP